MSPRPPRFEPPVAPKRSTAAREPSEQRPMTVGGGAHGRSSGHPAEFTETQSLARIHTNILRAGERGNRRTHSFLKFLPFHRQPAGSSDLRNAGVSNLRRRPCTVQSRADPGAGVALVAAKLRPAQRCGRCEPMRINVCCTWTLAALSSLAKAYIYLRVESSFGR